MLVSPCIDGNAVQFLSPVFSAARQRPHKRSDSILPGFTMNVHLQHDLKLGLKKTNCKKPLMFKQPPFLQKNIAFPFKTKQFHWLKLEGKARMVRRVKPRHSEDVGKPEILTAFSKGSKILAHEQNVWKRKSGKKTSLKYRPWRSASTFKPYWSWLSHLNVIRPFNSQGACLDRGDVLNSHQDAG